MSDRGNAAKQSRNRGRGRPFAKGQSGNPNGRPPKERCIPDILKKLGEQPIEEDPLIPPTLKKKFRDLGRINKLEALMALVYIYALQGKPWAVEFLAERTEGKVTQPVSGLPDVIRVGYENTPEDNPEE